MSGLPSAVRERLLAERGVLVESVRPVPGGANSEAWEVRASGGARYLAKRYPPRERDGVDRLGTEFAALGFLRANGERAVPEPVCAVPEERVGVFGFVEGARVAPGEVGAAEVRQALELLERLHALRGARGAERLPAAREACFSLAAHEALVAGRLARAAEAAARGGPGAAGLAAFLAGGLGPHFGRVRAWCRGEAARLGLDFAAELPPEARTLSPSDFGFHNAIRRPDGSLCFIDFEYFGWDDPAKTVADFFLQPAVPVPAAERGAFAAGARALYGPGARLGSRLPLVHALLACKWCLIVLNVFLREPRPGAEGEAARATQLGKARELLARAGAELAGGAFPFGPDLSSMASDMAKAKTRSARLDARSVHLRAEVLRVLSSARRGHVASAFSIVEILRVLYDDVLRVDPARPDWADRDRFVLSKGHGCLALYVQLAERGFFPREALATFCAPGSILGGHPQAGKVPGVEASTGSLGHGLPVGVGFALHGKLTGRDFRTFVLVGDGECDEGSVWEAALLAKKHALDRLAVLMDYNKMQCYAATAEVLDLEPVAAKWRSFGFAVREVDGHDVRALRRQLGALPFAAGKPSALICHTVKGRGARGIEMNPSWHHKSKLSDEDLRVLAVELGCEL